ncbi:hypothetical protein ACROYT_G019954 [Oculina patagonica]
MMYGFVNCALESLVLRNFGEGKWLEIKRAAKLEMDGHFLYSVVYKDEITFNLVGAAAHVLGIEANKILELFGEWFLDFCQESGYDRILQVLGGTLRDFISNLDALHDHLGAVYPGMRAPSFRVSDREDGALILHYYSSREGLEYIVIGLVRAIAKKLLNTDISVEIIKQKERAGDDVQFAIKEIRSPETSLNCKQTACIRSVKELDVLSSEPKISPATFCRIFPFHLMFGRDMEILQYGDSLSRVIKGINTRAQLTMPDVFELVRPRIEFTYEALLAHINTVFVLTTRPGLLQVSNSTDVNSNYDSKSLRLKGQILYLEEFDSLLFLCSPSVGNLDDLRENNLYLSDIPVHDVTRNLILLSEQFQEDHILTKELEILTDKLRQTHRDLAEEKELTDQLLYSILPPSVTQELRHKRPVQAEKFEMVTILFSGIVNFENICQNSEPVEIVQLLNNIYTEFDILTDPQINDVYKVETVGDKYMAVSGLPERNTWHARSLCHVALDMIESVKEVKHRGGKIQLRIGVHSGEVVAGVVGHKTPRYCLFGNTVNITSRTETTGIPDNVCISATTYRCLQKFVSRHPIFLFEKRGAIQMKGRDEPMVTYILNWHPRYPRKPAVPRRPQQASLLGGLTFSRTKGHL